MEENETEAAGRFKIVGNSHVVSLPKKVRVAMRLIKGDYVAMTIVGDRVIMRRISREFVLGKDEIDARKLQTPIRREVAHDGD